MEMTGLDPESDTIIEIATLITDGELNIIAEGPELAIHQPAERFAKMDAWNQEHHSKSGLWAKVVSEKVRFVATPFGRIGVFSYVICPNLMAICTTES